MIRILFVCHGNICRSPMAEFVFKSLISKRGLEKNFFVQSAAIHTDEIFNGVGNPVYPLAKAQLHRRGISCESKRARLLTKADYENFDLIVGMDEENRRMMHRIVGDDPKTKISLLLEHLPNNSGQSIEVSDPWYTRDFDKAYKDIERGCEALLEKLLQG